jgi:XTP/dITP diphosphohydrolase
VIEDAATLEGNAEKKARALHAFTGLPALADDTGLEVAALDGRPGVRSARFAGETATDADNRARLLAELHGQSDRRARFRTVLAFVDEAGALHTFAGVCAGRILDEERGAGGFGYDALFVPDGHAETFAEMTKEAKNRISHRALALAAFAAWLEQGGA